MADGDANHDGTALSSPGERAAQTKGVSHGSDKS